VGGAAAGKQETRTGSSWVGVLYSSEIRDLGKVRQWRKEDCVEDWMGEILDVISKMWKYGIQL
jgi:hypothetical protein